MINLPPAPAWYSEAPCRRPGVDREWFYPRTFADKAAREGIAKAFMVCGRCPFRPECLADALARGEPAGVWGGRYFGNGQPTGSVRNRRLIGDINKQLGHLLSAA